MILRERQRPLLALEILQSGAIYTTPKPAQIVAHLCLLPLFYDGHLGATGGTRRRRMSTLLN
jgi:hypothetical protein